MENENNGELEIAQQRVKGLAAGRAWAVAEAYYEDLLAMAVARSRGVGKVLGAGDSAWAFAVLLARGNEKEAQLWSQQNEDFWTRWARSKAPSREFVEAFVDAVLEVIDAAVAWRPAYLSARSEIDALIAQASDDDDYDGGEQLFLATEAIAQRCGEDARAWAEMNCKITGPLQMGAVLGRNRHTATNYEALCAQLERNDLLDDVYYLAVRQRIDEMQEEAEAELDWDSGEGDDSGEGGPTS